MPQLTAIQVLEYFGMITGVIGVWLTTRGNIWCWIVSILSVLSYIFIFYVHKIYADAAMQIVYLVMAVYGWHEWRKNGDATEETGYKKLTTPILIYSVIASIVLWIAIAYILVNYTDSPIPYTDAATTATSIVCTWLMAKKIVENWLFWIVIDFSCVIIYFSRELYPTAVLFIIFTILAYIGLQEWRKKYKLQHNA